MPTPNALIDRVATRLAWLRLGKVPLAGSIGRRLLRRGFPRGARRRVLLAYADEAVAYPQFNGFFHHADRFARAGFAFRAVPYTELGSLQLPAGLDAVFLQPPMEPGPGELERLLAGLHERVPGVRVALFDWFAPTDLRLAQRAGPWISTYLKKALLRDRSAYLAPPRGHTNLTDHYADRFGTENPPATWTVPADIIPRLALAPSFPTGRTLIDRFDRAAPPPYEARPIDLHARIATRGTGWYSAMRQEAAAAVDTHFADLSVARMGRVTHQRYMEELAQSKLCFSPFGYGELCWRDFEAIAAGAVLVKPDMRHVETQPDIFVPFETYIPVRWDLRDLDERVRHALADPAGARRIALNAYRRVRDYLHGPALVELVERLCDAAPRGGQATTVATLRRS